MSTVTHLGFTAFGSSATSSPAAPALTENTSTKLAGLKAASSAGVAGVQDAFGKEPAAQLRTAAGATPVASLSQASVDQAESILKETDQLLLLEGFGLKKAPKSERLKKALDLAASQLGSIGAASDLLPWRTLCGGGSAPAAASAVGDDDAARRAGEALAFLLDAPLAASARKALVDMARSAKDWPGCSRMWDAVLLSGAIDAEAAREMCKSRNHSIRAAGLRLIANTEAGCGLPLNDVSALVLANLQENSVELRGAALDLARRTPLRREDRKAAADLASRVLTTQDKAGNVIAALDGGEVAQLLAMSRPDDTDVQLFYKRAFGGTTAEQHQAALAALGQFDVSESVKRSVLDFSIKCWPNSLGLIVEQLAAFGLSRDASAAYCEQAVALATAPDQALTTLGFANPAPAELAAVSQAVAEGLGVALREAPLAPADRDKLFVSMTASPGPLRRVAAANAAKLVGAGLKLDAKAKAFLQQAVADSDPEVQLRAVQSLHDLTVVADRRALAEVALAAKPPPAAFREAIVTYMSTGLGATATADLVALRDNPTLRGVFPRALASAGLDEAENANLVASFTANASEADLVELARCLPDLALAPAVRESLHKDLAAHRSAAVRVAVAEAQPDPGLSSASLTALLGKLVTDTDSKVMGVALVAASASPVSAAAVNDWIDATLARAGSNDMALLAAAATATATARMDSQRRLALFSQFLAVDSDEVVCAASSILTSAPEAEVKQLVDAFKNAFQKALSDRSGALAEVAVQGRTQKWPRRFVTACQAPEVIERIATATGRARPATTAASGPATAAAKGSAATAAGNGDVATLLSQAKTPNDVRLGLASLILTSSPDRTRAALDEALAREGAAVPSVAAIEAIRKASRAVAIDPATSVEIEGVRVPRCTSTNKRVDLIPDRARVQLVDVPTTKQNRRWVSEAWRLNKPLWLEGPTSAGKTAIIREMCALTETPFRRFNLNAFTDTSELFGKWVPDKDDPTKGTFVPGPVTQAAINGECLLLDEMNLAPGQVLAALNGLLDDRGCLTVPGFNDGKPFKPHPSFRIFAATNPASFEGRERYDAAWLDRWTKVSVKGLNRDDLQTILSTIHGDRIPAKQLADLINFHTSISEAADNREIGGRSGSYAFSLRNLFKACERFRRFRQTGADGKRRAALDAAIMRREIEEMYLAGIYEQEDQNKVARLIDASIEGATAAEARATYQLREDPSMPGTFLLEETPTSFKIGDVEIKKIDNGKEAVPPRNMTYVLTKRSAEVLYRLAKAMACGESALLVGERGCGKTQIAKYFASLTGQEFHDKVFERDTDPSAIVGQYEPDGWHDGSLVKGIKSGGVFLGDEINVANPAVVERLNPLGDGEKRLFLTEKDGESLEVPPEFRFIAAMNPPSYRNRNKMSAAMLNRMTVIKVPDLAESDELRIILGVIGEKKGVPKEVSDAMVALQAFVNQGITAGSLGENVRDVKIHGMRTLNVFLDYMATFGPERGWQQAYRDGAEFNYQLPNEADMNAIRVKAMALCE